MATRPFERRTERLSCAFLGIERSAVQIDRLPVAESYADANIIVVGGEYLACRAQFDRALDELDELPIPSPIVVFCFSEKESADNVCPDWFDPAASIEHLLKWIACNGTKQLAVILRALLCCIRWRSNAVDMTIWRVLASSRHGILCDMLPFARYACAGAGIMSHAVIHNMDTLCIGMETVVIETEYPPGATHNAIKYHAVAEAVRIPELDFHPSFVQPMYSWACDGRTMVELLEWPWRPADEWGVEHKDA
jgi:hypothetical protein